MKTLLLALLATVAGLLMVGGGIYGVVSDSGDDDDDPPATTTTFSFPTVPTTPETQPGRLDDCDRAAQGDLRLGRLEALDLVPAGNRTGKAEITPVCSTAITLFFRIEGLRTKGTSSYYVWLFKSRRKAKQIGSLIGSNGRATGSATIQPEVDTTRYDEIVITEVEFGKGEKRPRRIVFRGSL